MSDSKSTEPSKVAKAIQNILESELWQKLLLTLENVGDRERANKLIIGQLNMRAKILACIEPHWRKEWKLATRKLAASIFVSDMVICGDKCIFLSPASVDNSSNKINEMRFDFRGVDFKNPSFQIFLLREDHNPLPSSLRDSRMKNGDNYTWQIKYQHRQDGYDYIDPYADDSAPSLIRNLLSMQAIPLSLWYRIFNAMSPLTKCRNSKLSFGHTIRPQENQVYIPTQHFNPTVIKFLSNEDTKDRKEQKNGDNGVMAKKWMSVKVEQTQNYNGEINYRRLFLQGGTHELTIRQVILVYKQMFRHDRQKLALATTPEMFQCIFENVRLQNIFGVLECEVCNSPTFKVNKCHLLGKQFIKVEGKKKTSTIKPILFVDGIIPPTLTFGSKDVNNIGTSIEATRQLQVADYFSCDEFTQMAVWALKVHAENDELISDKYVLNKPDRSSGNYFPNATDHFDNFDNVRGLLATTSVYAILWKYQDIIDCLQSSLASDPSHKPLPRAVAELVSHYFPLSYRKTFKMN